MAIVLEIPLLLSCPSDIPARDIEAVKDAVDGWNRTMGRLTSQRFDVYYWKEDAAATTTGRAQTSLNAQIVDVVAFGLVLLWTRVGTPTGGYRSGVDEELNRILDNDGDVAVLIKTSTIDRSQAASASEVADYITALQADKALTAEYDGHEELATKVTRQLSFWAKSHSEPPKPAPTRVTNRVETVGAGQRPWELSYQSSGGVNRIFFPDRRRPTDFHEFFKDMIGWYDGVGEIRILDSFMTDGWSHFTLPDLLDAADKSGTRIRILLSDPDSEYAQLRAQSLGHRDAAQRSLQGLNQLADCAALSKGLQHADAPMESIESILNSAFAGTPVELRLHSTVPSGPMYFVGDLLLAGRFPHSKSAVHAPWQLIVEDKAVESDLFASYQQEFDAIWEGASDLGTIGE